jgi:plasmid replication initiation protein
MSGLYMKPMKEKRKASEIRISNALNRASQRLTLSEKRIISVVLKAIDRPLKEGEIFKSIVKPSDIIELSGISKTAAYTELKAAEEKLWKREISWSWTEFLEDGDLQRAKRRWIVGVDYFNSELTVYLNPLLNKHISQLKERFTVYELDKVGKFKSINTWRLYELLRQERTRGKLLISIDAFRLALDIDPEKYKQFYDLEKRVIRPALEELLQKNGQSIQFEKIKDGKNIKTLSFTFPTEQQLSLVSEVKTEQKSSKTAKPEKQNNPKVNAITRDDALSRFVGAQNMAKLSNQPIEKLVSEKELNAFKEYGLI